MHPYGDTRTDTRPVYVDDRDDRAARWTVRLLAVALFVAVLSVTLVLSLRAVHDNDAAPAVSAGKAGPVETVTTLPPPTEVGPATGTELPAYVASRKSALAGIRDDRVAVVSLNKYSTPTQAKAVAGTTPIVALLVAPPGTAPAAVTGDLAAWVKAQTDSTRAERDEIRKLIPTVDDPSFKTFYTQEADRLDKALKNFDPASAMVFGFVVKAPAATLQALGTKAEVRLVDVGPNGNVDPNAVYHGLRPEETAKAGDPALRPV